MLTNEIIVFIILISVVLFLLMGGVVYFVLQYSKRKLLDLKEKEELRQQHRQQLLETQLEIQQQTMQDIGREIHDNVGQKLTLASIYSQQLDYESHYPDIKDRIANIGQIINESLNELRSLSKSLTSSYISDTPIDNLLESEAAKVNASGKCTMTARCNRNIELSPLVKTILLRVVQEFLQNSLKHAACNTIQLDLTKDKKGVHLEMKDDGKGFAMDRLPRSQGIGLQNIKRRAELINADLIINSVLSVGTSLLLFIPLEKIDQTE